MEIMEVVEPSYVTKARENVARGAAWLDAFQPDWADRVTGEIVMASSQQCVAGQALAHRAISHGNCCPPSGYETAMQALEAAGEDVDDYGFVPFGGNATRDAWIELINARRHAAAA